MVIIHFSLIIIIMAFSRINYKESKQSTYESIELSYQEKGKEKRKFFDSGNIIIDYYDYMRFIGNQPDSWYNENFHIIGSSSWDHFFMGGNKYTQSYFDPETGEFMDWRKAFDEKNFELYHDIVDKGKYPIVIHLSCHKNFNDVKRYYKKKTK